VVVLTRRRKYDPWERKIIPKSMFENLLNQLLIENQQESGGLLYCLPLSRALLDALEVLDVEAKPLVIRGVVFGRPEVSGFFGNANVFQLVKAAFHGPTANNWMDVVPKSEESVDGKSVRLYFRTIGQPHAGGPGDKTPGNYDKDGNWLGHLAVVANGSLIDPSIGQLNRSDYQIHFDPPTLTVPVSDDFLDGKEPMVFSADEMLVAYFAYPDEITFETSRSWTDPEFRAQLKRLGERTAEPFKGRPESELHFTDKVPLTNS
jgi:hypothetical protein